MHCSNCGHAYPIEAQFCPNCGYKAKDKLTKEYRRTILFTLLMVGFVLSILINFVLWSAYGSEYDERAEAENNLKIQQDAASNLSDITTGLCKIVFDTAVSEQKLRQETARLTLDCYNGNTVRDTDIDRITQQADEVEQNWNIIDNYLNSVSTPPSDGVVTQ